MRRLVCCLALLCGCFDFDSLYHHKVGTDGGAHVDGGAGSDPHACGGLDCTALPGVSPDIKCIGGSCDFPTGCLPFYANCSGSAKDGCVSLRTPSHCGRCTNACTSAMPLCSGDGTGFSCQSSCSIATPTQCGALCADLLTDPANCGACRHVCPTVSGAITTCKDSVCSSVCPPGSMMTGGACVTAGWMVEMTSTAQQRYTFNAVWGSAANDVYVVGDGDLIYHSTGDGHWSQRGVTEVDKSFGGVWGSSATDVYVAGSGSILHSIDRGLTWNTQYTIAAGNPALHAIWGAPGGTDLYAVGDGGTILYSRGDGSWTPQPHGQGPAGDVTQLWSVWGSSASDIYIAGGNGFILHSTGAGSWTSVWPNAKLIFRAVSGSSASDVWVVGEGDKILHLIDLAATNWAVFGTGSQTTFLSGLWISSDSVGYAVDIGGIFHRTTVGGDWVNEAPSGVPTGFMAVWGSSSTDVYVVGASNTILHRH